MIYAKVIADSISPSDSRLVTYEINCHLLPTWPQVLTHRGFSRNSGSSRAIPTKKLLEQVRTNPAMPVKWGKNRPGMQATEFLTESEVKTAEIMWRRDAHVAADSAEKYHEMGIHKQTANRVLAPYLWNRAIVTTTMPALDNFFDQRIHGDAQPEIDALARAMRDALNESTPEELNYEQWHTPYMTVDDEWSMNAETAVKVSAARCARVSYLTHNNVRDVAADLGLYDFLRRSGHWSPLEHVCTPGIKSSLGNLDMWDQLRHLKAWQ